MFHSCSRFIASLAMLLMLATVSLPLNPAGARDALPPVLLPETIISLPSGLVTFHGEGFSPGGLVFLAVYDRWGLDEQQHVWTVASTAVYGPNGSVDPAQGFAAAGTVREVIAILPSDTYGPNGSQDPAQGYVAADSGITRADFAETVTYGPHGSQDPAQGYSDTAGLPKATSEVCDRIFMVQAYDAQTSTWSNPVDVTPSC